MSNTQTIEIDGLVVGKSMVKSYHAEIEFLREREKQLQAKALETFHKLENERKRVAGLEARIKMMSTVENNLRDGLKQIADERDKLKTAFKLTFAKGVELQGTIDKVRNLVIEESHESYQTITSMVLAELNAQPEDKS